MSDRSEKEKMLAGELYLATDPELVAMQTRARELMWEYNRTRPTETAKREELLKRLFGRIGPRMTIEPPFYCDYGCHIFAGERFYMNYGCVILDVHEVHIGDNVLCAPYVQIIAAHHPTDPAERVTGRESATPVRIGSNVWLGSGVIVCPGVTIGDNTTIGAGSIVVKDIPSNVVAAGNPCRVIKSVAAPEA